MKNRKTVVVAFLLVAAMLLSVGYAAFTDTLAIDGNVTVSQSGANASFDADVYFSAATPESGDNKAEISSDKDTVTLTVAALDEVNEEVTFTLTVKNDNDFAVNVAAGTAAESDTQNCFTFTVSELTTIGANDEATVTVNVKMTALPQTFTDSKYEATYDLSYTVTDVTPTT